MEKEFKYYAFISYNSKDTAWGKRLQRKLENYRMPATLCSQRGWKRKPINPVFFAPTDIQPGELDEELKERLRASKNLIVICSPNSAQSEWVGKEIKYFQELGRDKEIYFFIVAGIPNSGDAATECFNPVIGKLGLSGRFGANIHEKIHHWPWTSLEWAWMNREQAYVRLISKLLGIEFDSIWRRHRRQLLAKAVAWFAGILTVFAAMLLIWANNQPFDTKVRLDEVSFHNSALPPLRDAVITMSLDRETKTDTIISADESAIFMDIPHKYLDKEVRITFVCPDFMPIDTTVTLTKEINLRVSRDQSVYGNIRTELWDYDKDRPVTNTQVWIENRSTQSDDEGIVRMTIPLESQKSRYQIRIPDYHTTDTITMPTNEYHSIRIN